MRKAKEIFFTLLVATVLIISAGNLPVFGLDLPPNQWGKNPLADGDEWSGTLFMNYVDTGQKKVRDSDNAIPYDGIISYEEYVVEIKFFLKLYKPTRGSQDPVILTISGQGKTCEETAGGACISESETFYLIGDFPVRHPDAFHYFLNNMVYPEIFAEYPECETSICTAQLKDMEEQKENFVETQSGSDSTPPWYMSFKVTVAVDVP